MKTGAKRNPRELRAHLVRIGVRIVDISRMLGCSSTLVHRTLNGEINNRHVLRELVRLKCPRQFLDLPRDMREAA